MKETMITPGGLARLTDELDRLRTTGRQEVTERIRQAIATDADPTANTDYLAAREEQALLESRIARLEQRLAAAQVAEPDAGNGVVDLGERVRLRDLDTGARLEYEVVGSLDGGSRSRPDLGGVPARPGAHRPPQGRGRPRRGAAGAAPVQDRRHRAAAAA